MQSFSGSGRAAAAATVLAAAHVLAVLHLMLFFFFQAEDGIRDDLVTGVQTCALPISLSSAEFFLNQRANRPNYLLTPTMPDRRFKLRVSKKACRCHHAFNAHHLKKTLQGWAHPCFYPGCDCKDYRPEKRKKNCSRLLDRIRSCILGVIHP